MNLIDDILKSQGGNVVGELARAFNLNENQAKSALSGLLPSITKGLEQKSGNKNALDSLLGALDKGNHDRYIERPQELSQASSIEDGKKILGHLLGSKEASRQVAKQTAESTGLSESLLKQMLPAVASLAMGSLSQQRKKPAQSGSSLGSLMGSLLDRDGDGSVADDVLDMARKLF